MQALCKGQLQALNLGQESALYLLEAKFFFVSWSAHQPLRWAHCSLHRGLSQHGERGWVRTENYGLSPGAIHFCFLLRLGKPRPTSEPCPLQLGCDRAFIRGLWGALAPIADTFAREGGHWQWRMWECIGSWRACWLRNGGRLMKWPDLSCKRNKMQRQNSRSPCQAGCDCS